MNLIVVFALHRYGLRSSQPGQLLSISSKGGVGPDVMNRSQVLYALVVAL
jgi:hypothetical protein